MAEAAADNPYLDDPPTEFPPVEELDLETAREEVPRLRAAIRYHDHKYYVENDPVIADRAYDRLFDRLQTLESTFDLQTPDSPTQRVGGQPVDHLPDVEHVRPMLSIDSDGEPAAVREWAQRTREDLANTTYADPEFVCEPKFDGLSIEVIYEDGQLTRAATRGDGEVGDDVTDNVRTIPHVPLRLRGDYPDYLAVRGEIYIPRDAFQELNRNRIEAGTDPFANPRNAAAGTLRQLDPSVVADRPLACYFFDVLAIGSDQAWASPPIERHTDLHDKLPEWGLRVADRITAVADIEEAIAYRDRLLEAREDLNYEIDGVVIKVNDRRACEQLGATARHYRWAFAYKFPARTEKTTLRDIVVQVGRTGRLTPVALLDPVDVGGVTVSRASLHNPAQIEQLGVGIGDRVRITRAGDVIPQVTEVLEDRGDQYTFPDQCPACDSPVQRDGPMAFCTGGMACPRQLVQAVVHYASDSGLDIEGLGERTVEQLHEAGLIADGIADVYELDRTELESLEGWGKQSADNLLTALENTTEPSLTDFIAALGIPGVGPTVARDIAVTIGSLDALIEADQKTLESVDGIGPKTAANIREFFDSERNRRELRRLRNHGVDPQPPADPDAQPLTDLTIVFTGSVDGYTRAELQDLVETHGGRATSSVSGATDYLVAGNNPGRRKQEAAEEENVPVLDPEEFFALLADRGIDIED